MAITTHSQKAIFLVLLYILVGTTLRSETKVTETAEPEIFTAARLSQQLGEALTREFPNERGEFKVTLLRPHPGITVPEGEIEFKLTQLPSTGLRSRIMLGYELRVNSHLVHTESIPTEIQIMREVLVSTRRLNRGKPLLRDDLSLEIRDVLGVREPPVDPYEDLSVYEIQYTLMRGNILTQRHIRLMPVVGRGDIVTGWLKRGLLQINLKVEVMEEAAPGQLVRIRNIKTKKNLRGIVYDENSVIIP